MNRTQSPGHAPQNAAAHAGNGAVSPFEGDLATIDPGRDCYAYLSEASDTQRQVGTGDAGLPENLAACAEQLLPDIARRLFTLSPEDPLSHLPGAQLKLCSLLLNGARTMSQLSEDLNISVSAVTQLADRLEKSDLVERRVADGNDADRRTRYLALTPQGMELMAAWRQWRVQRVEAALAFLAPAEQENVVTALQTLLAACRRIGEVAR